MEVFGVAIVTKNVDVAGRRISIETGRVAEQANGAVIIRQGDSVVLSTAVMSKEPREGIDWFPLTCDYEEKLYAAGKIPGAFMRREGRPSETAILASRLTDRPLRPLFPEGFRLDVQVISTVLSVDQENDPTILSINGASTALVISDIPFQGPVGAVRMGYIDQQVAVNPPMSQMGDSELDLVVAGTADAILMVEAGAKGVSEQVVLDALAKAHEEIKRICTAQLELREQVGLEKREWISPSYPEQMVEIVGEYLALRLDQVMYSADKHSREAAVDDLRLKTIVELGERFPEHAEIIGKLFDKAVKDRVRQRVVEEGVRVDGLRVRLDACVDGRGRADQVSRRRHRDGTCHPRGQVRGPHRHPGRRGRPRGHGLQGRRDARGHHRPPDGHQDQRPDPRDHGPGPRAGPRGAPVRARQDARRPAAAANRDELVCAADHDHPDLSRHDTRHHRQCLLYVPHDQRGDR